MVLPFFYSKEFSPNDDLITLDEQTSRHTIQVLRMKEGDELKLTNGKGLVVTASISSTNKKAAVVKIISREIIPGSTLKKCIAISPIKNSGRFEWFLEKVTEIGVNEIILLICHRTEKQNFRLERIKSIIVSAMLQSQQAWLPEIYGPVKFEKFIAGNSYSFKYIGHCAEDEKQLLKLQPCDSTGSRIVLIGPEGDFTHEEVKLASGQGYIPVSLGNTRLRTETAGIVAAVLIQ
ncbi:MAG: RsmE family RNA methyltransferase [Chitinophagaceae bacterium]